MAERVYFDSCVFIELLQKKMPDRLACCLDLVARAKKGEFVIVTSTVSVVEVSGRRAGETDRKDVALRAKREKETRQILDFFENPYIVLRALDRRMAEEAQRLTWRHGIKNLDAIHVVTALANKCTIFYTYDGDGNAKGRSKLINRSEEFGDPPMRIMAPPHPLAAGGLFTRGEEHFQIPAAAPPPGKDDSQPKNGTPFLGEVAASAPKKEQQESPPE